MNESASEFAAALDPFREQLDALPGRWIPGAELSPLLSARIIYLPSEVDFRRTVGIASSRIGRRLEDHANWLTALQTVLLKRHANQQFVTVAGTTCDRFVSHGAELFGIPCLRLATEHSGRSISDWLDGLHNENSSPQCSPAVVAESAVEAQYPLADRLLFGIAGELYVLSARKRSQTTALTRARTEQRRGVAGHTRIIADRDLIPESLCEEFLNDSDVLKWIVLDRPDESDSSNVERPGENGKTITGENVASEGARVFSSPMLTHCTRAAASTWPGETEDDFLTAALCDGRVDRSAFATLCRIVLQKKLVAGCGAIRGGYDVVCFSEKSPDVLIQQRIWRKHLMRWDYEPYGIAIDQHWLKQFGARPVFYGDDAVWEELAEDERLLFQKAVATDGTDWRDEQEWRVVGDVPLANIPTDRAVVFVATIREQLILQRMSPWPVVVMAAAD